MANRLSHDYGKRGAPCGWTHLFGSVDLFGITFCQFAHGDGNQVDQAAEQGLFIEQ